MEKLLKAGYRLLTSHREAGSDHSAFVDQQLKKAQRAWLKQMNNLKDELGVVILPEGAPELGAHHLANCKMVSKREMILQQMKKGGVAAEVGVQTGLFSRTILQLCQPRSLHLIDYDLSNYSIAKKFVPEIRRGQVTLHESDSSTAIKTFPDNHFDFIYIDADHSYEGVKKDIAAAKTKVKEDGYLIFNDYTYWSPGECINYGVVQAVNELCVKDNWEFAWYALASYMRCDVAIRRMG